MALTACGGGRGDSGSSSGSSSIDPGQGGATTPISVVGRIDAFGSVFVDGIEFDTSGASYRIDDHDGTRDSDLSVGMIVRVDGESSGGGRGRAYRIHYDDDVEGPVANLAVDPADADIKRFTILGIQVVASAVTTVFKGDDDIPYTFDGLANGDHVEVSGDFDGETLVASFIEKEDEADEDFELKGIVSEFDGTAFILTLKNGAIFSVTLASNAEIPAAGIQDGQLVEVEAIIPDPVNAPAALLALRVELEHEHDFDGRSHGNRDELRLKGFLNLEGTTWSIRGTELQFDANTEYRPTSLEAALADGTAAGRRVRVLGTPVDGNEGMLLVERIDAKNGEELEVKGMVESVSTDSTSGLSTVVVAFAPAVGTVSALVGPDTLLKNDDGDLGFAPEDLIAGTSFVEIHGYLDDAGAFIAIVLEAEDEADEYEVKGPLDTDGFDAGVSITLLGVTFMLDAETDLEDGPPENGAIVEVEDENRDGVADKVEVKSTDDDAS